MRQNEPQRAGSSGQRPGDGSRRPSQWSHGGAADDGAPIVSEAVARSILEGDSAKLVRTAEDLGKQLAQQRLKTSQIRNVFGSVRRIELSWPRGGLDEKKRGEAVRELLMLKPKLAYQAARHRGQQGGDAVGALERNLRPLIDGVGTDRDRFQRFVDFFEATLAYHRSFGGSD